MPDRVRKASSEQSYNKVKRKMKLRIKKNPLARVAFRIFALCLCLLASTAHATAQEVVYERVTNESQLVAGEKYIFTSKDATYAMGYQKTNNRHAVSIVNKKVGNYIIDIPIASGKEATNKVYEFTLGGKVGEWIFYDDIYSGYLYAAGKKKTGGVIIIILRFVRKPALIKMLKLLSILRQALVLHLQ